MSRKYILSLLALLCALSASAQADRREVRAGNRKFRGGRFAEAEIDYRKALVRDSVSVPARYDLASALYRQQDYAGAARTLSDAAEQTALPAQYHYNVGDAALQQQDYRTAVAAFRQALLLDPADLDAKENYIYAKKMLENQQNGGGGADDDPDDGQDDQDRQNQEGQDQADQQNQDQDQKQDPDGDGNERPDEQPDREPQISPQQAQQMLRAIQAREQETQDKVNREKAALLKSRQKEKNW